MTARNLGRILRSAVLACAAVPLLLPAQELRFDELRWREIGPTRAGRARPITGVPSQPGTVYVGFDNGGLWRSSDYGSNWLPVFDGQPTGSIGAVAVAESDPNVIYVGTGAAIIRPDLAIGDGVYRSGDGGKTWSNVGLRESQMIAAIAIDPRNADRFFVAALGHPYGPNPERGVFRSTNGGRSFEKVLFKDDYTSANDVLLDPRNPDIVYAALWQQQQSFIEGQGFGGEERGIYKSTDGGSSWTQLSGGLPPVLQANLAISASSPNIVYAAVAPVQGAIALYKSTDGGRNWFQPVKGAQNERPNAVQDARPMARIGGGDLPTITVDPKNPDVVYSATVVMWRSEDGGVTWSAVRGAPGGDDYQRIWIDPNNTNVIASAADQGAVISANRGLTWSNWYNQNTALMYHATTDFSFPYSVCSGQQDAGSACVSSRSNDGRITFHDWHPVNIQEYGIAAPDPHDPNIIFGSARSGVSRYDRRTGQTSQVGPDLSGTLPGGGVMNRNVRTMPLHFSPVDNSTLFYAQNVVFRSNNKGRSWTRISPDLTRQTWEVPANMGQYAQSVSPRPMGSITALSPSPRSLQIIWAGTDDGNIQTTSDGGRTWQNVTPSAIKPWTRIYNIEAGHFDNGTAYAAANTLRLDDINPHFYRTHDAGKTWTEISSGIAGGAVANSIREDPRQRGLLYAATDTQVWVSFDDGEHWQSLKNGMPSISVRDLTVKDDSTCHCSDLVAATHGRGFWILDDVTPLRQTAALKAAASAGKAYLFKPGPALRVRFGTNDPTPWPPELPSGDNPPAGGVLDYYLPANVRGEVLIEIVDARGRVARHYSSLDPIMSPHPATDREAYETVCRERPTSPFCGVPLYWPAPQDQVATAEGTHRLVWDMHMDPVAREDLVPSGNVGATGAVPGRTYPSYNVPWAPPGRYTVRLSVNGEVHEQQLTVMLDPRVVITPANLKQLNDLSMEMYDAAVASHQAFTEARALSARIAQLSGALADSLRSELAVLAPANQQRSAGGGFRRFGSAQAAPNLETVSGLLQSAASAMQAADVAPTESQIAACNAARAQYQSIIARWQSVKKRAASL